MSLLEVKNVKKIYTTRFGSNQVEALRDVNFTVERGEYVAIMGESGSGKTTLLNILAALDKPTEGKVYLKDRDLGKLKEKEIATFRRQNLGFVFQDFNLLDPYEVSGGQKQRAAIARALITKPQLILADEPSGALDSKAADSLMNLFTTINQEGQTIVMVTHSVKVASSAKRVLFIKDGKVFHQLYRGNLTNEEMYERISDTLKILTTGGEEDE